MITYMDCKECKNKYPWTESPDFDFLRFIKYKGDYLHSNSNKCN
jgi:hypothetical protein